MQRDVVTIGVPVDLGAGRRGVDMGPSAIRYAGLRDALDAQGIPNRDAGNISVPLAETITGPGDPRLRYLEPLVAVNAALATQTAAICAAGGVPLVLGGDHSVAIGSVSGVARGRSIGLLWIDAHADFNTAETTPSGNIHGMSVAALTGHGHPALTGIGGGRAVREEHVALVGVRSLDREERAALRASGVHVYTMHEIDRRGMAAVIEEALERLMRDTDGLHVSLDLDALDPRDAPGVGTPIPGGLAAREAHLAMEIVAASGKLLALDLVEVNPILDDRNKTAELAVLLALSALGQRIL